MTAGRVKDDPRYPIYDVSVRWEYDANGERTWNGTGFNRMYREDPGEDAVRAEVDRWWDSYEKKGDNPGAPEITVRRYEESWCQGWFSHHTFDVGQSDSDALASFSRYVDRYAHMQDYGPKIREDFPDYICLMGAEDRWRWHSGSKEYDGIPCRCEHCQRLGVLRIAH